MSPKKKPPWRFTQTTKSRGSHHRAGRGWGPPGGASESRVPSASIRGVSGLRFGAGGRTPAAASGSGRMESASRITVPTSDQRWGRTSRNGAAVAMARSAASQAASGLPERRFRVRKRSRKAATTSVHFHQTSAGTEKRLVQAWKTTSESHSWLSQGRPAAVYDQGSVAGSDRRSQMSRPAARCHQRSPTPMRVKPNDQKVRPAARYQRADGRAVAGRIAAP